MRVLSLVPSATETLLTLGVTPVACTRFCEQPGIPTVGGTKNPDVASIVDLHPDLVVMNDEENRREDYDALRAAGVRVHSMSPRSLADVGPAVEALAIAVGAVTPQPFGRTEWSGWLDAQQSSRPAERRRCLTLIWRRPWMGLGIDTYGSSVLAALGCDNMISSGSRYPELSDAELAEANADVVLLPSEPYTFTARHRDDLRAALPGVDVRLLDGRDLLWWGTRTREALVRVRAALR